MTTVSPDYEHALDTAILALREDLGRRPSKNEVWARVGGNRATCLQYLGAHPAYALPPAEAAAGDTALEPVPAAPVVAGLSPDDVTLEPVLAAGAVAALEAPTARARLVAKQAEQRTLETRVAALATQAATEAGLSTEETLELLHLQMRVQHLAPHLARLQQEAQQEAADEAADRFQARWWPLAQEKREAYAALEAALLPIRQALLLLMKIHRDQYQLARQRPGPVTFPDVGRFAGILSKSTILNPWLTRDGNITFVPDLRGIAASDPGR